MNSDLRRQLNDKVMVLDPTVIDHLEHDEDGNTLPGRFKEGSRKAINANLELMSHMPEYRGRPLNEMRDALPTFHEIRRRELTGQFGRPSHRFNAVIDRNMGELHHWNNFNDAIQAADTENINNRTRAYQRRASMVHHIRHELQQELFNRHAVAQHARDTLDSEIRKLFNLKLNIDPPHEWPNQNRI